MQTNLTVVSTEAKATSILATQKYQPEYFEVDDASDSFHYLYMKLMVSKRFFDFKIIVDVAWQILYDRLLTPKEKIRLFATTILSTQFPKRTSAGLNLLFLLFAGYTELDDDQLIKKYSKIIQEFFNFVSQELRSSNSDQKSSDANSRISPLIYQLLFAKTEEDISQTLKFRILTSTVFARYFFVLLSELNLSKQEYLAILGKEVSGYETNHYLLLSFNEVRTPKDVFDILTIYFDFLFGLLQKNIFSPEDILEHLANNNDNHENFYRLLSKVPAYSSSIRLFISKLLELISFLPTSTPVELVRMHFNSCIAFTYAPIVTQELFTSRHLDNARKTLLLQINSRLVDSAIIPKNSIVDNSLIGMCQRLQQEKDINGTNYLLLRQSLYEQLASMILHGQFANTQTRTQQTIPLLMDLLTAITQHLSAEITSRYLYQVFNLVSLNKKLSLLSQLILSNSPEGGTQLFDGLIKLHRNRVLSANHLFQLFYNNLFNLVSPTTPPKALVLLDSVITAMHQEGFSACYLFKIYLETGGNHDQNYFLTRMELNTNEKPYLDQTLIERWLSMGIAPSSIYFLLTQENNRGDHYRTQINSLGGSRLQNIAAMEAISIFHALTNTDNKFTTLIACLRTLIHHGLPALSVIKYFLKPYASETDNPSLLEKIIAKFEYVYASYDNSNKFTNRSIKLLFDFLAEIDPEILNKSDFYNILNRSLEIFYQENENSLSGNALHSVGTVLWHACEHGMAKINSKYAKIFLNYLWLVALGQPDRYKFLLVAALDPSHKLGAYFRQQPNDAFTTEPLRTIIHELKDDANIDNENTEEPNNAAYQDFLVQSLAKLNIPLARILRIINPSSPAPRPLLQGFDSNKVLKFDYSSRSKQIFCTTTEIAESSFNRHFDIYSYPAALVENDTQFRVILIELMRYLNAINNSFIATIFINVLKEEGFFKNAFNSFFHQRLSPESMESLFGLLEQIEIYGATKKLFHNYILNDFLQPYLVKDTAAHAEASGYLLWLKAKYAIASAPFDGVDFKIALDFFIRNNFRNVATQAQIYFACLNINSTLGMLMHQPYHYILAQMVVTRSLCQTAIEKGALLESYKRLCYLKYLADHNIQTASVVAPTTILTLFNADAKDAEASYQRSVFNPTIEQKSFTNLFQDAEAKHSWINQAEKQAILAFCNSELPITWGLITETERKAAQKSKLPNPYCCSRCQLSNDSEQEENDEIFGSSTTTRTIAAVSSSSALSSSSSSASVFASSSRSVSTAEALAALSLFNSASTSSASPGIQPALSPQQHPSLTFASTDSKS